MHAPRPCRRVLAVVGEAVNRSGSNESPAFAFIVVWLVGLIVGVSITAAAYGEPPQSQDTLQGDFLLSEGVNGVSQPLTYCVWEHNVGCHMTYLTPQVLP